MAEPDKFAAQILRRGQTGYAGFAASLLVKTETGILERYGPNALQGWKNNLTQRLEEICAALETGHTQGLLEQIEWERLSFMARQVPESDLALAIHKLGQVLSNELPENARGSVMSLVKLAARSFDRPVSRPASFLDPDVATHRQAIAFIDKVLEGRTRYAVSMLRELALGELGPMGVVENIIIPAQREIGRKWHNAEASVAEEHLVTEACRQALTVLAHTSTSRGANGLTVLIAMVAGNHHNLGTQVLAMEFEIQGWRTINLLGGIPVEDICATITEYHPELVLLSASLGIHLPELQKAVAAARQACTGRTYIMAGGRALLGVSDTSLLPGADACGSSLEQARAAGRQVLEGIETNDPA